MEDKNDSLGSIEDKSASPNPIKEAISISPIRKIPSYVMKGLGIILAWIIFLPSLLVGALLLLIGIIIRSSLRPLLTIYSLIEKKHLLSIYTEIMSYGICLSISLYFISKFENSNSFLGGSVWIFFLILLISAVLLLFWRIGAIFRPIFLRFLDEETSSYYSIRPNNMAIDKQPSSIQDPRQQFIDLVQYSIFTIVIFWALVISFGATDLADTILSPDNVDKVSNLPFVTAIIAAFVGPEFIILVFLLYIISSTSGGGLGLLLIFGIPTISAAIASQNIISLLTYGQTFVRERTISKAGSAGWLLILAVYTVSLFLVFKIFTESVPKLLDMLAITG